MNRLSPSAALVIGGVAFAVLFGGLLRFENHGSWLSIISIAVVTALLWKGLMKLSGFGDCRRRRD